MRVVFLIWEKNNVLFIMQDQINVGLSLFGIILKKMKKRFIKSAQLYEVFSTLFIIILFNGCSNKTSDLENKEPIKVKFVEVKLKVLSLKTNI